MTKSKMESFMEEWNKTHERDVLPGAMLMKYGPQDYVGATVCVRGTLFFKGSHTPEVREAICKCFDAYEAIAKDHLTWLWREEPPEGPDKYAYDTAPTMRAMVKKMGEQDQVSFAYLGGEKPHDASPWMFFASGMRAWEAKLGWNGLDSLRFSVPKEFVEKNPTMFQKLFVDFARLLKAEHGAWRLRSERLVASHGCQRADRGVHGVQDGRARRRRIGDDRQLARQGDRRPPLWRGVAHGD